jgi:hypothetical protein
MPWQRIGLLGMLALAACGDKSGGKTPANAGTPPGDSAGGGMMRMPGMDSGKAMGGTHMNMQGMQMMSMTRAHMDSMMRMAPEQMRTRMTEHDAMMSRMMDAMGSDMRGMRMQGDTA